MPTLSVGVLRVMRLYSPGAGFLLGRVAWLQVISPDMLVKEGDMRSLRVQQVPPPAA